MIFREQLSKRDEEIVRQRDVMLRDHEKETAELRDRLEEIKSNDNKTKEKLKEAATVSIVLFLLCLNENSIPIEAQKLLVL